MCILIYSGTPIKYVQIDNFNFNKITYLLINLFEELNYIKTIVQYDFPFVILHDVTNNLNEMG